MTDEPEPQQPTLAEASTIDAEALKRWLNIPLNADVILNASRQDMDNLLLGLRQLLMTQGDAMAAFQLWALDRREEANASFLTATASHLKAWTSITNFTSAIMAKAEIHG